MVILVEGAVARMLKVPLLCSNHVQIVGGQEKRRGYGTDAGLRMILHPDPPDNRLD